MSAILDLAPPDAPAVAPLDLRPEAGRIGAEVRGVALDGDLDAATLDALQRALDRHQVLCFRGQHHLTDASQQAFARRWGALVPHPTVLSVDGTQVLELDSHHGGRANSWHTDVTFDVAYPKLSVLRAVVVPSHGGDTVWAHTAAAHDDLPAPLRALADTLWAVHGNDCDYAATRVKAADDPGLRRYREVFRDGDQHRVVRRVTVAGEAPVAVTARTAA